MLITVVYCHLSGTSQCLQRYFHNLLNVASKSTLLMSLPYIKQIALIKTSKPITLTYYSTEA